MTVAARFLYWPSQPLLAVTLVAVAVLMVGAALPDGSQNGGPTPRSAVPTIASVTPLAYAPGLVPVDGGIGGGAQGCTRPVERGSARIDLCWQAYRSLSEEDVRSDYYVIEVTATARGGRDGMKWAVVRAHPLAGWTAPAGGQGLDLGNDMCQTVLSGANQFPGLGTAQRAVLACEHWRSGETPDDQANMQTDWDCGCYSGVTGDRDVSLVETLVVPQGVLPTWELGADVGS